MPQSIHILICLLSFINSSYLAFLVIVVVVIGYGGNGKTNSKCGYVTFAMLVGPFPLTSCSVMVF